jgi:hypothetical protein
VRRVTTSQCIRRRRDAKVRRKSIVGGDRERAEILAAVRKGILKSAYLHTNIFSQCIRRRRDAKVRVSF